MLVYSSVLAYCWRSCLSCNACVTGSAFFPSCNYFLMCVGKEYEHKLRNHLFIVCFAIESTSFVKRLFCPQISSWYVFWVVSNFWSGDWCYLLGIFFLRLSWVVIYPYTINNENVDTNKTPTQIFSCSWLFFSLEH